MINIKDKLDICCDFPAFFNMFFAGKSFAVLDIETTGLSPNFSAVILIGLVIFDGKEARLEQFFAETPAEEKEIIALANKSLEDVDYVVTYNGKLFDIPFLNKRSEKYGIKFRVLCNLDLFMIMKHYSDLPKLLGSMSQKSLEVFAGLSTDRSDKISGKESVELYSQYQTTGSKDMLSQILLHNSDDIKQLFQLVSVIKHADFSRAICHQGMPHEGGFIEKIDFKHSALFIKGHMEDAIDYISFPSFEAPYSVNISKIDSKYVIEIPAETMTGSAFIDIKNMVSMDELGDNKFPGFDNNYLIIKENNRFNYTEIAIFAQKFTSKILSEIQNKL